MVRLDVVALAFMVKVLEQVIAGNVATTLDQVGKPLVLEGDGMALAAFPLETEDRHARLERHMIILKRCQSEGAVVLCVLIIADADERGIKQGDDEGAELDSQGSQLGTPSLAEERDPRVLRATTEGEPPTDRAKRCRPHCSLLPVSVSSSSGDTLLIYCDISYQSVVRRA